MIVLYIILALIVIFLAAVLIRTAAFRPQSEEGESFEDVSFDRDAAVSDLAALVKCRTVSDADTANEDDAEFDRLTGMLPELYPDVAEKCTLTRLPGRALLYKWPGRSPGEPAVLMAHYDVVPVEEENWLKPPFGAVIEDGVMWGRGTLDTKVTFNGILFAANSLIGSGFVPEHDIYLAFSGGEEVNGPGAVNVVEWFSQEGITPAFVLDEGGAVVDGVFPGVNDPCALIGIAEKGLMNLKYTVKSDGGHASAPLPHTPVGRLAAACAKVENHPFKCHYTAPVRQMFDVLGRRSTFAYRMIFANLWCFGGILDGVCRKSGGELNALIRTTAAFTQMDGSKAPNVIPPEASMVSNIRLNPEDSVASAKQYIKNTIGDEGVALDVLVCSEPSPISRTDCEGWKTVVSAVKGTWRGALVSPYLMVQCSDSRHYRDLSDRVFRFSAMDLTAEERHTIHGNNERIRLDTACRAVEFFTRVMKRC